MAKKYIVICLMGGMLMAAACAQETPPVETKQPVVEVETEVPAVDNPAPLPAAPQGWLLYVDDTYGFSFAYPEEFEILTDADSLYGWENGILLLYNGGQSYDISVQLWDTEAALEAHFGGDERLHVFPLETGFLSVMNITLEADSEAIIATFYVQ